MTAIPGNIIISRTDSIGDVVLTLPVAAVLKEYFPSIKIAFLGKAYTKPVIDACKNIDQFIDVDDFLNAAAINVCGEKAQAILHVFPTAALAKKAKQLNIPLRIGTTNRLYHWATCNKLVKLSRKNSPLHEAQLNIKLLAPLGVVKDFSLEEIGKLFGLVNIQPLLPELQSLIDPGKYNIILHTKSQGNGREWPMENFVAVIRQLNPNQYKIFISGTEKERPFMQPIFDAVANRVVDITGKMQLPQFISFINSCNGLVASGTGPLHIAAALGKDAFGIFPPIRPVHPGRWAPLGVKAHVFCLNKSCNDCKGKPAACACIRDVEPILIKQALDKIS